MMKQYPVWQRRGTAFVLAFALTLSMAPASMSSAAKKVSLSKKKLTITVGKSKKLKLKNNKKKVSWKVVSGKTKVKLKAKKKTSVTIVAKKKGKAKVQAKVGKKKYTCKVTVVKKSTPTPEDTLTPDSQVSADPNATATAPAVASGQPSETNNPGQSNQPDVPTQNPGSSSQPGQPTQPPGQNPGGEISLGDKTAFHIGSKKLALGISRDEVLQVVGSATRTEKSPQGFDVIVYNPGGTYNGYTLIYLKDNVVVSLCAVGSAGTVSYGNLVKTGDEASTLAGTSGWSGESWFAAKDGESKDGEGAYKYSASNPNATVLAYVDYYRGRTSQTSGQEVAGNKVYCIQAYSNTITRDQMIYPAECEYNTEILNAMKLETAELLMAYRIACGFSASQYPLKSVDGLAAAAKQYLDKCPKGSDNPPDQQNSDKLKEQVLAQNGNDVPMHFAQITMAGSSDSIGFANSVLEQKDASDYIIKLSYTAKASNGTYYQYCYQYFGIAAADDGNHHTYMVIDLVDRWNTSDKRWYGDNDVDEGWE